MSRRYLVRTYGCQMNEHDSERIAGLLEADGLVRADSEDDADVVVLNTCCIRENADNKLYGNLGHLKTWKGEKDGRQIVVSGCLAQKDQDRVAERAGHVDVVMGTHNVHRAAELLREAEQADRPITEILTEAVLGGLGIYLFLVHMVWSRQPLIRPEVFKDVNFSSGLALMFAVGTLLVSSLALMTPWLQVLSNYSRLGFVRRKRERAPVNALVARLRLKAASLEQPTQYLSGGNQQKVALMRPFLRGDLNVILADEPTQGVDVGARLDIYHALRDKAAEGTTVLVKSSDAIELAGICNRVVVMSRGVIVDEIPREELSERRIIGAIIGRGSAHGGHDGE